MTSRLPRTANALALIVLALVALWARWEPLTARDLYDDEALQTTITRSFLEDGSLNNFRYSTFAPGSQFSRGVWVYYPPGFILIQAPFLLIDPASPVTARLPVLMLNMLALLCLPSLSKAVWGGAAPGWAAAGLGALSPFHVSMSVTGLTYTFVAPLLVLAFGLVIRALRLNRRRDWMAVGLLVALGFYIVPIALAFGALLAAVFVWSLFHRRADVRRGVLAAAVLVAILCAPWVAWAWGANSALHTLLSRAPNYSFTGQARLVLEQYDIMLPSPVWKLAFVAGLAVVSRRAATERGLPGALLGIWALAPVLYVFARSMWVTPRHVFGAHAAMLLVTGLGMTTAISRLAALTGSALVRGSTGPSVAAVCMTLFLASGQLVIFRRDAGAQEPYRPMDQVLRGDAAVEFGAPAIVSSACAYITARGNNEPVIAPIGQSEAHYLGRFVHDRRTADAKALAWTLARTGPVWVFMGDNYAHKGELDDFDRTVQQYGRLIMHSAPIAGFTSPDNTGGYALYHLDRPLPPLLQPAS